MKNRRRMRGRINRTCDLVDMVLLVALLGVLALIAASITGCSWQQVETWEPAYRAEVEASTDGRTGQGALETEVMFGPLKVDLDARIEVSASDPTGCVLYVAIRFGYAGLAFIATVSWAYLCEYAEVCVGFGPVATSGLCFELGESTCGGEADGGDVGH